MPSTDRPTRFRALPDAERCSGHARFVALYREHFDFVFRNLRRLGVNEASVDDALQDVYMAALRRIADYRDDTHPKAWLFAITMRLASNYRRAERHFADFGPTLAHEKLVERKAVVPSVETLRKWMSEAGLGRTRKERRKRAQPPRQRRA